MTAGLLTLQIYIPYARSLKDKRQVLRRLKDRLRAHFNVAIAEVDHQDLWQRATVAVVTVSGDSSHMEKTLRNSAEEAERLLDGCAIESSIEIL